MARKKKPDPERRTISAFSEGMLAREQNRPITFCPYTTAGVCERILRESWLDGWGYMDERAKVEVVE